MRKCVILSVGVLLVLGNIAVAGPPQRHAVIVGINAYADARIPDLKYAESDARAVYATLTDPKIGRFPKENVTLILGKQATPSAIKAALYKLRGAGKDDLVVIFYSGHGAKEGDEAFWVTQNADAKALPVTSLTNSDIRKRLAEIPSQRLVMLLDCCYAASTVKKSLVDPTKLFGDFAGKGRVTIAGSADNQEALEYTDKKAGIFSYYLVQGLQGQADTNDDGAVTFGELWAYLGENVRQASVKQGGLHEPVIITESGVTPQFLLTLNPVARAANDKSLAALRKLFDKSRITGAHYDEGRKALTEPAIDPVARATRDVYVQLVSGRLEPRFLDVVLKDAVAKARAAESLVTPSGQKPTLAIVPFDVLGDVKVKDAGAILAERLLPLFADRYQLIDQARLRRFMDQDDLTLANLAELATGRGTSKGSSKAVRLRAVRLLVVGTLSAAPDGLTITARMSDWQTGRIDESHIGQVMGEDWKELVDCLPVLAAKLMGIPSPDHRKARRTAGLILRDNEIAYLYRGEDVVHFKVYAVDVRKLVAGLKAYVKSGKVDPAAGGSPASVGLHLLRGRASAYRGKLVASWDIRFPEAERKSKVGSVKKVTTPLKKPGAYYIVGQTGDDHTDEFLMWLGNFAIATNPVDSAVAITERETGKPVSRATVEFFGYSIGRDTTELRTTSFIEYTDDNGVCRPRKAASSQEKYQNWIIVASTADGRIGVIAVSCGHVWTESSLEAGKLTDSLGGIGSGPDVALPPLPAGVDVPSAQGEEGFVGLFDGKTLEGWMGATKGYAVEDGAIVCLTGKGGGGNLFTAKEYSNFVLRFEFQLTAGANNGLAIRTPLQGNAAYAGMELQVLDNSAEKWAKLKDYMYHASVYGVAPAKRGHLKPIGEWNTQEVTCNGRRMKVVLNGTVILDVDLDEVSANGTLDKRPHPGLKRTTGHIGFVGFGSRVAYRDLRIKELQ